MSLIKNLQNRIGGGDTPTGAAVYGLTEKGYGTIDTPNLAPTENMICRILNDSSQTSRQIADRVHSRPEIVQTYIDSLLNRGLVEQTNI